jgi:hypothetical protein
MVECRPTVWRRHSVRVRDNQSAKNMTVCGTVRRLDMIAGANAGPSVQFYKPHHDQPHPSDQLCGEVRPMARSLLSLV